ncbi:MAG TPA: cytochrome P450 [Candidatus Kryptonia bacterium]|nr:cytochrome P450 [Candidatus Kryptonia bacterium]
MEPINLLDGRLYAGDPSPTYAWLRANAPVYRDEINGLWGVSRYADVMEVSRHPELFCSGQGSRPNLAGDPSMINQDAPRHTRQRGLVNKGFTPRRVAEHEPHIRQIATQLIDAVAPIGRCDFVQDLAAPLPMILIAELLGVRTEDRRLLQHWSDEMIKGADGLDNVTPSVLAAFDEFVAYQRDVIADRRRAPRNDLMTILVNAEIDGSRFENDEIIFESLLLLVGGNETTRNVISGAMEALIRHPEQRAALRADPSALPTAAEEFLRWVTPVLNMRRTATRDVELSGRTIRAGDQLLLLYGSANRDETVFVDPERFDVARQPNPHVAFGFGAHFCLGASLARLEIRVMFEELLRRLPDIELVPGADVVRTPSSFIRGIHSMPVQFTPRGV